MLENSKLLADFKDELVGLYGYSEELAEDIVMIADSIADHFGREYAGVIEEAIRSTKVILVDGYRENGVKETVADILMREGMSTQIGGEEKSDKDLRNVQGMYCEKPNLSYNGTVYSLTSVEKVAIINSPYVSDSVYFRGLLTNQLMKSVKGQLQAHIIEDDHLITKNGLATKSEKLSYDGNTINRQFVKEKGYGLEEAVNNYDTLSLMRNDFYDGYDLPSHTMATLVAGNLVDGLKLGEVVRVAEVTKDTASLEDLVNSHTVVGYDHFVRMMDEMHDLENKRNATLGTDEQKSVTQELDRHYAEVARVMSDMRVSMKLVNAEDMTITEGNTL